MKASAYNHFIRAGNRTLAYNAVSNGLALIDDEVLKALQSPESIDALISSRLQGESATLLRELKRGRFVIESDFDEIEYLRLLYNRAKYDVVAAGLTIAPTLDCNFNCTYCYEEQRSSRMTDEVKQHLCRYVAQIVKVARSFQVTWYGGEPLLCPDVIEELSKEFLKACEENHCAYHASIVTNGSLLTRETALALKEHKIETAQITFDGPREVHDSRRCYRDGRGSFDTIVANIEATRDVLRISIRVNVDKSNKDYFRLAVRNWGKGPARFIGALRSISGVTAVYEGNPSLEVIMTQKEFVTSEVVRLIVEHGVEVESITTCEPSLILIYSALWNFVYACLSTSVIFLVVVFVLGMDINVNLGAALFILLLSVVCMSGFGLMSAGIIMVTKQGDPITWAFGTLSGLLSGAMFPIELLPPLLRTIAAVLPHTHALIALRKTIMVHAGLGEVRSQVLALLALTALTLPIGLVVFRWGFNRARIDGSLAEY